MGNLSGVKDANRRVRREISDVCHVNVIVPALQEVVTVVLHCGIPTVIAYVTV